MKLPTLERNPKVFQKEELRFKGAIIKIEDGRLFNAPS